MILWWLVSMRYRKLSSYSIKEIFNGEFDSGSGRTLAACLTHASRTDLISLLIKLVAHG